MGLLSASERMRTHDGSSLSQTCQNGSLRLHAVLSIMNLAVSAKRARIGRNAEIISGDSRAASSAMMTPSTERPLDVLSSPGRARMRAPATVSTANTLSPFSFTPAFTSAALTRRTASAD